MSESTDRNIPLCVDLDGTLISSDTLLESTISAIRSKPFILLLLPFWILKGKLYFKNRISRICLPNPETMPYRDDVVAFLKNEKKQGRRILLITASVQCIADSVASHLGCFDESHGSGNEYNLVSKAKANFIVKKFGEQGYDYIGDSCADIPVWDKARRAYVVGNADKFRNKLSSKTEIIELSKTKKLSIGLVLKEMRIYQWLKNLLLFVPLLLAHRFEDSVAFTQVFAGFFSFGFIASFVYIINDMLDLESDRKHPRKKNRPLASGDLSLKTAFALAPVILIAGIFLSLTLTNHFFTLFLLIYLIITLLYSIIIKSFYILDIIILSLLYTLRLIAGAVSANVYISPWLLEFSIFIFLSLATVKRFTELKTILAQNKTVASGRGYITSDINFLFIIGIVSGFLSALVFTLYIHSEEVVILYKEPIFLWPVSLCFLTWIIRVWFKAHRGEMHDDPVVFTFKDKLSIIIGILIIALITCAIVF